MNQYIGRLLDDRYEILEVIGTGGMAVVYKALCHRLNRLVAVKILKDEFSGDEEFRRRFRAEGEAVAMLSHPNIVQVYDVSSSDSANYIVIELIDGISLKQYMEVKGVLNWKETLHFAMQIAKGLEHAHSRGIVHRDIKPHNVMVLKNGSVKVMDFGIARVMNKSNTLTKEALGSVHYISPEQAKGGHTDNRSDLYSLGVVMYEMMTGRPPFDGESPVAVAIQHISGGAPLPSALNPNIPRGLEQIIMKAMALDPKDRYDSATQMLQDMEEFRKNPAIVFAYRSIVDDATRTIPGMQGKTVGSTAERVARAKGGSISTSTGTGGIRREGGDLSGTVRNHVSAENDYQSPASRSSDALRRSQKRRQEEQRREAERSRAAAVAVVACSAVAVIAIVVFLVAIFNGALLGREQTLVDVPYLEGTVYSEDLGERYPDLIFRLQPQQYDSTYPKGQIMHQEPSGGSQVSKGTEVFLTVSLGEEPLVKIMDNLVDVTEEVAKAFLTGQGFNPLVRYESNTVIQEGNVIRTDPAAGVELKEGQTVNLWVSTGPEIKFAKLPNVVGMTKDNAVKLLNERGFVNVRTFPVESDSPKGQVVTQSGEKETEMDVNTEIILEISEGPEPVTEETAAPNTEAPSRPSQETTPDIWEQDVKVTFTIPAREQTYYLSIRQGGVELVNNAEIAPGTESYVMTVNGTGHQEYDLYIDGQFYQTQSVELG